MVQLIQLVWMLKHGQDTNQQMQNLHKMERLVQALSSLERSILLLQIMLINILNHLVQQWLWLVGGKAVDA